MADEEIDKQSWAVLQELWETPVGRRWVLKAGLGSAIALGVRLYGWPGLAPAKAAVPAKRAAGPVEATYQFRLGSLPGVSDLTLVANGARTPLADHTRASRAELRQSGGLWRTADVSALTHHASGVELPGDRPLLMTVLGRRGGDTVVVGQKWHVPASVTSRLAAATYKLSGTMAPVVGSPRRLDELGVDPYRLRRPEEAVQLGSVVGLDDAAFGLISVHPNIATIAPDAHKVTEALLTATPELDTLANHIASMQTAGRDYATYDTAVGADGKPYEITFPAAKTGPELKTTFETFALNDRDAKLKSALRSAVTVGITTVRDSKELGAVIEKPLVDERTKSSGTWIQPRGVTPLVRNQTAALKASKVDVNIKNTGLNSGTYVAANGDFANGKAPLKLYNNYVRWVSVYVQYLGKGGKNLSADPAAKFPDTPYAKSLGLLPQVFTVLGVPLWDTNTIEVELEFPKGAHAARILMCGLGADIMGGGWRQYFPENAYPGRVAPTDEVLVPALLTGILTIGMNVFALATDVDIAVAWSGIRKTIQRSSSTFKDFAELHFIFRQLFVDVGGAALSLTAAEALAASIAAGAGTYEDVKHNGHDLSNLWNIVLGLASVIPKFLFSPAAGKIAGEIALQMLELETAQKLAEALPVIGQVLAVISAVGDAATLAEVAAETIVSPWVIENEVSVRYDATITISPDGRAKTFPATARSWRLEASIEGALTLDPITGPINQGGKLQSQPLSVKVATPFGGKDIQWTVVFLDGADRQVGGGASAKLPNDDPTNPPSNVAFAISQLPATITDSTVFERSATTTYDPAAGGYTWSDKVAVTGTVHQKGVQEVTGAAVATLAGVAGMVFKQGDRFYVRGVPVAQDGKTIELGTARVKSFARRPFLLLDPFVEANDGRNHVLLEPDDESDAYHVRRVSLDPKSGDISWDPAVNLGTFALPVSDAALHSSGKVVAINTNSGRLGWIQPADTPRPQLATFVAGPGTRVGLLRSPVAVAITNPGTVLVLEAGTAQIAAFDLNGNPARYFKAEEGSERAFRIPLASAGRPLDMAVDGSDQIYVLYVTGDGDAVPDYRIDVYTKGGELFNKASSSTNVPRLAIDYWRSIFAANYDPLTDLGTATKRIDPRLGVPEPSLSRFDPTG
jgi:hypothetical protein